jgi:hypothetical protein
MAAGVGNRRRGFSGAWESGEVPPREREHLMLCDSCRWSERPGFVRAANAPDDRQIMIPCPDCGGTGIAHCCDGICEQPDRSRAFDEPA